MEFYYKEAKPTQHISTILRLVVALLLRYYDQQGA